MNTVRFLSGVTIVFLVLGALLGVMLAGTFRRRSPGAGLAIFRLLMFIGLTPWLVHVWYVLRQDPAGSKLLTVGGVTGAPGSVIAFLSMSLAIAAILTVVGMWLAGRLPWLAAFIPLCIAVLHYVFAVPFLSAGGMDLNLQVADPMVVWLGTAVLAVTAMLFVFGLFGIVRGAHTPSEKPGGPSKPGKAIRPSDAGRAPSDITAELARSTSFKPGKP